MPKDLKSIPETPWPPLSGEAFPAPGGQRAGLYVHVPFCLEKCPYCDFFSITDLSLIPRFVEAVTAEMRLRRKDAPAFDTLYIGGGTPSVLEPGHIQRIIRTARDVFDVEPGAEITLEANPGTVDTGRLEGFLAAGVNRLNIGVQSFHDPILGFLGRIHTARSARQVLAAAGRAGFTHVGLDLMYGVPGQDPDAWAEDLEEAVGHGPEHLSCYMLTIEPATPMADALHKGRFVSMPEPRSADLLELTQRLLTERGYRQYEISNYAVSDRAASRHNTKYWTFAPYEGLGPSAHSFRRPLRWWNHRNLHGYLKDVEAGRVPVAGKEVLGMEQQIIETLYLRLRTAEGIDIPEFNRSFSMDFYTRFAEPAAVLETEGMMNSDPGRLALTAKGMRFHEGIAKLFIEYV